MSRLSFVLAAAALVAAAPTATADDCKVAKKNVAAAVRGMDAAAAKSIDLWAQCVFGGPDAKAVTKIEAAARRAFGAMGKLGEPDPSCVKAGSLPDGVGVLANSAGQRLGLAWATCSPTAQARVAQLAAAGKSVEEIQAELGKMSEQWITNLLK